MALRSLCGSPKYAGGPSSAHPAVETTCPCPAPQHRFPNPDLLVLLGAIGEEDTLGLHVPVQDPLQRRHVALDHVLDLPGPNGESHPALWEATNSQRHQTQQLLKPPQQQLRSGMKHCRMGEEQVESSKCSPGLRLGWTPKPRSKNSPSPQFPQGSTQTPVQPNPATILEWERSSRMGKSRMDLPPVISWNGDS